MKKIKNNNTTWLQLLSPKMDELLELKKDYGFHSITLEELKRPSLRAKVERYKDYIYMVIHFPIYNQKERTVEPGELDFLITKNTLALATIHYTRIQALDELEEVMKNDTILQKKYFKDPVRLLYHILSANFEFSQRQLEHIRKNILRCESEIYHGNERQMLEEIAYLMRDVTNFKRMIKFHHEILESLQKEITKLFGTKYRPYLESLCGQARQVADVLETYHESAKMLHDTNQTLFSAKTNEAIKVLTVISVFTFPLSLLAAIFAWDTKVLPIVGMDNDFWILIGIFAILSLLMYAYFRKRKWL